MKKKTLTVKVIQTAARRVVELEDRTMIEAPAEYAVQVNDARVALIIKAQDGWRVCTPTPDSEIGVAISPVGLNTLELVRQWAIDFYKQGQSVPTTR